MGISMAAIVKQLQLEFIPKSTDLALLLLRVALGTQMIVAHGWGKLAKFSEMAPTFPDPLHVGHTTSLVLATLGEALCTALLVLGLFTRPAAMGAVVTMGVAFLLVHGGKFVGEGNGELSFVYLVGFLTIFLAGPGRFSLDSKFVK
jgi:putative oxidoreductase